jgi:hypothetical protein
MPAGTEILAPMTAGSPSPETAAVMGLVAVLEDGKGLSPSTPLLSASRFGRAGGQKRRCHRQSGSTGNSTGPHLHFEVIYKNQYLNPLFFSETGDDGSDRIPPGQAGGVEFPAYPGAPMGSGSYAALMEEAQKHLGKPYVFGAKGPDKFDCSGFVCWSLSKSGVRNIATNAQGLYNASTPVSRENAQPGDLIFFKGTYSTHNTVTHVGIYIGNGQMIHAGKPVQYASIDTRYWRSISTASAESIEEVTMNPKIQKTISEIEKTKTKIAELQARLQEQEAQRIDMENTEIVGLFRSVDVAPQDLADFIRAFKAQNSRTPINTVYQEKQEVSEHEA